MAWSASTYNFGTGETEYRDASLLTNFDRNERGLYDYCVEWYNRLKGEEVLYINDTAYDVHRNVVRRYNALHKRVEGDKSDFWIFLDNARDTNEYKNYIKMCRPKKWVG